MDVTPQITKHVEACVNIFLVLNNPDGLIDRLVIGPKWFIRMLINQHNFLHNDNVSNAITIRYQND